jgi:hypothetical protein
MSTTTTDYDAAATTTSAGHSSTTHISQLKSLVSFYNSAIYGNKKVFMLDLR